MMEHFSPKCHGLPGTYLISKDGNDITVSLFCPSCGARKKMTDSDFDSLGISKHIVGCSVCYFADKARLMGWWPLLHKFKEIP